MMQVLHELRRTHVHMVIDVAEFEIMPRRWDARLICVAVHEMTPRESVPADCSDNADVPSSAVRSAAKQTVFAAGGGPDDDTLYCDPLAAPADGNVRIAFRFSDGREIAFHYIASTGYLVDLSRYEHGSADPAATMHGFATPPSFGVLVARIVATGASRSATGLRPPSVSPIRSGRDRGSAMRRSLPPRSR